MRLWVMAAWVLFAGYARAQTTVFHVDSKHSKVIFTLGDVLHTIHGTFQVSDGEVRYDRKTSAISGQVEVSAGSGKSGNDTRDRRMGKDVLEAGRFAIASFKPQQMLGVPAESGDSTVKVSGIFTVHGLSHPLKIPVSLHVEAGRCIARTHFVVPYIEWGMKDPSTFILRVAKEVTIDLTLIGQMEEGK